METQINIRPAEPSDMLAIVEFNQNMAQETEGKQLASGILTAGVAAVFADAATKGFYVVAENEVKEVVGCLLITFEWSDWRNGWFWWIQSVYVRAEYRGQGVYRKLYDWVKSEARRKNDVRGFRLYVEKENEVAQNVYEKLGMEECVYLMYEEML